MTKTVSLNENISIQTVIALTRNGDEVVIEENGEPLAKVLPIEKSEPKRRVFGLGKDKTRTSDDFDEEISLWENASDEDFLNFEKELAGEK